MVTVAWFRRRRDRRAAEQKAQGPGAGSVPTATTALMPDPVPDPAETGGGARQAPVPGQAAPPRAESAASGASESSAGSAGSAASDVADASDVSDIPAAADGIPWRELDGGAYARLLGPLAADPAVGRLLDTCARGALAPREAGLLLAECPDAADALRRLVAKEEPAGPEASPFVAGVISTLGALPPEEAVPLLVRLAERNSGLTTGTVPPARAAIRTLAAVPGELVPPALHRLAAEARLATLRKAAYAELKRRLTTLADAPEWSVDSFGLDADSQIRFTVGRRHTAVVRVATGGKVSVVYHDASGRALAGKPAASALDPAGAAEATDLAASLRAAVRAAKTRLESAQKERREIPTGDWLAHYLEHPVTGRLARTLLWEVRAPGGEEWRTGLPQQIEGRWSLITVEQARLVPEEGGVLRIALPRRVRGQDAKIWSRFLGKAESRPVLPQIELR